MDADLDTLATALYVRIDDWLTACPEHAPARPPVGIGPRITDAELATLSVRCRRCWAIPVKRGG